MDQLATAGKRTRSILVIEVEHQLRMGLVQALSEHNWRVLFAMTEETIAQAVQSVAGVMFSPDGLPALNHERILKMIGDLPLLIARKPYSAAEIASLVEGKISKDQFFVGDRVLSKVTPDWGLGTVVSTYEDQYYGVIFKGDYRDGTSEIAIRCHFTGLKKARE